MRKADLEHRVASVRQARGEGERRVRVGEGSAELERPLLDALLNEAWKPLEPRTSRVGLGRPPEAVVDRRFGQIALVRVVRVKSRARAVVVGGGVAGCSVAYHLAKLGVRDVVLLERYGLADGTTWHSAGFVGQLRSTLSHTRMMMYSAGLYPELERETGLDAGWRGVGGLRLATSAERLAELKRQAGWATTFGLALELVSPEEARTRCPVIQTDDVLAAAWLPGDGWLDPELLCRALAEGARRLGVEIQTETTVNGVEVERGRPLAVETSRGRIETEIVVNATGVHAPALGRLAGVSIPIVPMLHEYLVTDPFDPPVEPSLATVRDPDHIVYFREEAGGLLVGGYARRPEAWPDGASFDGSRRALFPPNEERFAESLAGARARIPALEGVAVARWVHGLEAFTPDGEFILGETDVRGFWVAAGFCVHGLAAAGGVGKVVAEWIVDGKPEYDVSGMAITRFGPQHRSRAYSLARALESYSKYYDIVYPGEERQSGRPLRLSPTYERLVGLGAVFGEKSGWERANWFEANAAQADERLRPRGWAGRFWSPAIAAEHRACRETAALFDETSFAKIDVAGAGAADFLERLCDNRVARDVGAITYTQMLNPRGGIECDFTVTRLAEDRFRIVTGTAFGPHDLAWIRSHAPDDDSVFVEDVTSRYACLGLWGPAARSILAPVVDTDLSNGVFRYMRAREIEVDSVPCLALRVTYVGELGWELYCATEFGLRLWDTIWEAGREHGLVAGGYKAIDSLRIEKGYRVWGTDITPDDTPWQAGLGFAVKLDKGDFVGRDALAAAHEREPERTLACLVLDDPRAVALGSEPVRVNGAVVGRVTSGGYGYSVERSIAYAYVPAADAARGRRVEVEIFGERVGAEVAEEPLWDPAGERIRSY